MTRDVNVSWAWSGRWCRLESLPGPSPPPPHGGAGDYTGCLCGGNRNEHTGEINSDVQNHQQELMRRLHLRRDWFGSPARLGQANAACYCGEVERSGFALPITSVPYERCYVWNRAHDNTPARAASGFLSPSTTRKRRIVLLLCSETRFCVCESNFCLHTSCFYNQDSLYLPALSHPISPFDSFSI